MRVLLQSLLWLLPLGIIAQTNTPPPKAVPPLPTARQLQRMSVEMSAFVHFTVNTFTNLEWGYGNEPDSVFNPTEANPEQWVKVLKEAGFKQLIFTCKHHDGFCLWPSAYTEHSIKNSPYKNGRGDLVGELSEACHNEGMQLGIYLSPWDRNSAMYATPEYITYYRNQLTELITQYGPVSELWLDGANGGTGYYGGSNDRRQISRDYYGWDSTIQLARSLQASEIVVFGDAGPDIRWVGNEQGYAGETNWYAMETDSCYVRHQGFEALLASGMENGANWIPSEVDVSIRPGWFYHPQEDDQVKTAEELFQIYLQSVGRGAVLLLNVPPDQRGLISERDVSSLQGFRALLDDAFQMNLATEAHINVSSVRGNSVDFDANKLNDNNRETYWSTDDGLTTGFIEIQLDTIQPVHYVVLQEYLPLGQRVGAFYIEVTIGHEWQKVAEATTMGMKRIIPLKEVSTDNIRIQITRAKACLTISEVAIY